MPITAYVHLQQPIISPCANRSLIRVAYSAFPLALYILDIRLSISDNNHRNITLRQLGILIDAMKVYYPQYDGVEWVAKVVRDVVQHLDPLWVTNSPTNWTELLTLRPSHYLQLSVVLDWSLRRGRCPNNDEFKALDELCLSRHESNMQYLTANQELSRKLSAHPISSSCSASGDLETSSTFLDQGVGQTDFLTDHVNSGDQTEANGEQGLAADYGDLQLEGTLHPLHFTPPADSICPDLELESETQFQFTLDGLEEYMLS